MKQSEKFKILFVKHSDQVAEKRKKIHATTEKYVALNLVIIGWFISFTENLDLMNKLIIIMIILVITATTMYIIYRDNRIYREHAKIVKELSESIGAFNKGAIIEGKKLYPESWQNFGTGNILRGVFHHYLIIVCIAILTCFVIFKLN